MSNESEVQELKTGTHIARFEPPDMFTVKLIGDYSVSNILSHAEFYKRAPKKFYLLLDTSEMGSFSTEAKKVIKEVPLAAGVAVFGASRQAQLVLSLLTKVYMMVNMGKAVEIKFVSGEAEGRRWLDSLRQPGKAAK